MNPLSEVHKMAGAWFWKWNDRRNEAGASNTHSEIHSPPANGLSANQAKKYRNFVSGGK
jgi:hypothetical protein